MDINELKKVIEEKRAFFIKENGKKELIEKNIKEKEKVKQRLVDKNERNLLLKTLIEKSSEEARENGRVLTEELISSSIQDVFGENTKAELKMTYKDGIPNLSVYVSKKIDKGTVNINPSEADGGGIADIIDLSAVLGIGQLVEKNFAPNILDEPTKYVSEQKTVNSALFVKNIVNLTGKQTIVSTHDKSLMAEKDTGYEIIINEDTGVSKAHKRS